MGTPRLSRLLRVSCVLVAVFGLSLGTAPGVSEGLTLISGMSPYPDGGDPNDVLAVTACNGGAQFGVVYRNSETEPHLAVNPTNPLNMIAAWHQDRWSTGGGQGVYSAYSMDGGQTWTPVNVPFTACAGADPAGETYFERASDPWITYGPDGAAYFMALVLNRSDGRDGMAVAKSVDGGVTWSTPIMIKEAVARGVKSRSPSHDKNTITADPYDANLVYATWLVFRNNSFVTLFTRSTDGGETWEPTRPVNKFEPVEKHVAAFVRQGAQIVVLPDGTLLNIFYRQLGDPRKGGQFVRLEQAHFRSFDKGKHWERLDTTIDVMFPFFAVDAELFIPIRDAGSIPDIGVNRQNGYVYAVWQDTRFNEFGLIGSVISVSRDGGDSWSDPIPVNRFPNPLAQGFLPTVAVNNLGNVGVLYYDFRNDVFGDAELSTDVHLAQFDAELNFLGEDQITEGSFDMRQMVITGNRGFFPGDYMGLDTNGNDFLAAFTVANNLGLPLEFPQAPGLRVDSHNRQDIAFAVIQPRRPKDEGGDAPQSAGSLRLSSPEVSTSLWVTSLPGESTQRISYTIPEASEVTIRVFDVAGRLVRTLAGGEETAGLHSVEWDAAGVSSGIYFLKLQSAVGVQTQKVFVAP